MSNNNPEIDILETCCFPKECILPDDAQQLLTPGFIKQLEDEGLSTREWTRGALMYEEPYFTQVQKVACTSCNMNECTLSPKSSSNSFSGLMNTQYAERVENSDQILRQLLPGWKKIDLENIGIKCIAQQMPSRKNPKLLFSFHRGEKIRRVTCEIGKRLLCTDEGETTLISLKQISQTIEKEIATLRYGVHA